MGKISQQIIDKIMSHSMCCLLFNPIEFKVGGHEQILIQNEYRPVIAFGRSETCTNEAWNCTSLSMRAVVAEIEEKIGQTIEIIEY
jgi:hypothetical protein